MLEATKTSTQMNKNPKAYTTQCTWYINLLANVVKEHIIIRGILTWSHCLEAPLKL